MVIPPPGKTLTVSRPEVLNKGEAADKAAKMVGISGSTLKRVEYCDLKPVPTCGTMISTLVWNPAYRCQSQRYLLNGKFRSANKIKVHRRDIIDRSIQKWIQ